MFLVALVGNGAMFVLLCWKLRRRLNKVHLLLLHLNVSDLIVTVHNMPKVTLPLLLPRLPSLSNGPRLKEIAHSYTVAWDAGDWLCRACKFVDVFGVYLSSNLLIVIALDRYQASDQRAEG